MLYEHLTHKLNLRATHYHLATDGHQDLMKHALYVPVRLNRQTFRQSAAPTLCHQSLRLRYTIAPQANELRPSSLASGMRQRKVTVQVCRQEGTGVSATQQLACGIPLIDRSRLCSRDCIILFNVSRASSAVTARQTNAAHRHANVACQTSWRTESGCQEHRRGLILPVPIRQGGEEDCISRWSLKLPHTAWEKERDRRRSRRRRRSLGRQRRHDSPEERMENVGDAFDQKKVF